MDIRLVREPFDPAMLLNDFCRSHGESGGIVSFIGQVRPDGEVNALELRHYGPLTLPDMRNLGRRARDRWGLDGVLIAHRTGTMLPGEAIVFVAAAGSHRREAFLAADFMMDHLKSAAWFWKREKIGDVWRWVEPRPQDYSDLQRWV